MNHTACKRTSLIGAFLLSSLGACTSDEPTTDGASTAITGSAAAVLDACQGVLPLAPSATPLEIGTTADYPPFTYLDGGGSVVGWERDYMTALCTKLGRECHVTVRTWGDVSEAKGIFHDLITAKSIDLLIASVVDTPERREKMDFSNAYYASSDNFFVLSDNDSFDPSTSLAGKTVATQRDTWWADTVAKSWPLASLTLTKSLTEPLDLLKARQVDAIAIGGPSMYQEVAAGRLKTAGEPLWFGNSANVGYRKNTPEPMRKAIDCAIQDISRNGTFAALTAMYPGIGVQPPK